MSFAATDLFSFGAQFNVQNSRAAADGGERPMSLASDGDVACVGTAKNIITESEAEYEHCGGVAHDIVTDLNAVTTAPVGGVLAVFGSVLNSILLTSLEITLNNKSNPSIRATGHQHPTNAHAGTDERQFAVTSLVAAQNGQGITMPMLSSDDEISVAATSTVTEVVITISLEHMESEQADGDHFRGQNRTCQVRYRISGIGTEDDITLGANWYEDTSEDADSNSDDDTFSIEAYQYVDAI